MINFSCSCGKEYQVREQLAGRQIKCSNCLATLKIPFESTSSSQDSEEITNSGILSGVIDLASLPPAKAPAPPVPKPEMPKAPGSSGNIPIVGASGGNKKKQPYANHRGLRPLGQGDLSLVFTAFDENLKRDVALKTLLPAFAKNPVKTRQFVEEAELLATMEQPGILPVYTSGRDEMDVPYYTMQLYKGRPLNELIYEFHSSRSEHRLREIIRHLIDVARTMSYAHEKGYVHRDINPGNILIGLRGETWVMKWRLAKKYKVLNAEAAKYTAEIAGKSQPAPLSSRPMMPILGPTIGIPAYIAPEQACGDMAQMGPAADIYSIGAILYEVIAATPTYCGDSTDEILQKIRSMPPLKPSEVNKSFEVNRTLEAICLKALRRMPQDRYVGAQALADDLTAWLDDEPVSIETESTVDAAVRWVRKNKAKAITFGVVAVLVFLFLVGGHAFAKAVFNLWSNSQSMIAGMQSEKETAQKTTVSAQLAAIEAAKKLKMEEQKAAQALKKTEQTAENLKVQIKQKSASKTTDPAELDQLKKELQAAESAVLTQKKEAAAASAAVQKAEAGNKPDAAAPPEATTPAPAAGGETGETAVATKSILDSWNDEPPPADNTNVAASSVIAASHDEETAELQGEYQPKKEGRRTNYTVQVVARGGNQFELIRYANGFPGDGGWKPGDGRTVYSLTRNPTGNFTLTADGGASELMSYTNGILRAQSGSILLEKVPHRPIPGLGKLAPKDGLVLFAGEPSPLLPNARLNAAEGSFYDGVSTTALENRPYSLHVEFQVPLMLDKQGAERGSSGIFLHDCYEVRIVDSFGDVQPTMESCGAIAGQQPPLVPAFRPPLQWQSFDIDFTPPKYEGSRKISDAVISARLNGQTIHDDYRTLGWTDGRDKEGPGRRPIHFAARGCNVQFRNVWLLYK